MFVFCQIKPNNVFIVDLLSYNSNNHVVNIASLLTQTIYAVFCNSKNKMQHSIKEQLMYEKPWNSTTNTIHQLVQHFYFHHPFISSFMCLTVKRELNDKFSFTFNKTSKARNLQCQRPINFCGCNIFFRGCLETEKSDFEMSNL